MSRPRQIFDSTTDHTNTQRQSFSAAVCLWLILPVLAACSLAGDVTPPPGFPAAPPAVQPTASGLGAPPNAAALGAVAGQIANGTAGAPALPADQKVALHIFDNLQPTGAITVTASSDGAFAFPGVPLLAGRVVVASTTYSGVIYTSDAAATTPEQTTYNLPIRVYETTGDPSAIRVEQMHVIIQLKEGAAQISELFLVSNNGDRTYAASAPGAPTINFSLPAGYRSLSFQEGESGERFIQTAEGFADTLPVVPGRGAHQILVAFTLPYDRALNFSQNISYPTSGVNVLLPEDGVQLRGSAVSDQGRRDVEGASYRLFTAEDLNAGDTLSFKVTGSPRGSNVFGLTVDAANLLVGSLALAAAIVTAARWWMRRRPRTDGEGEVERLIDEIAALDDQFAAGELDENEYRDKRGRLKSQVRTLMERRR